MKGEGADGLEGSRWTNQPCLVWQSMLGSLMTPSSLTVNTQQHTFTHKPGDTQRHGNMRPGGGLGSDEDHIA